AAEGGGEARIARGGEARGRLEVARLGALELAALVVGVSQKADGHGRVARIAERLGLAADALEAHQGVARRARLEIDGGERAFGDERARAGELAVDGEGPLAG